MPMKSVISPEEGEELKQLYKDLETAHQNAVKALSVASKTPDGELKFIQAERTEAKIMNRIKEILGISGQHWMAL